MVELDEKFDLNLEEDEEMTREMHGKHSSNETGHTEVKWIAGAPIIEFPELGLKCKTILDYSDKNGTVTFSDPTLYEQLQNYNQSRDGNLKCNVKIKVFIGSDYINGTPISELTNSYEINNIEVLIGDAAIAQLGTIRYVMKKASNIINFTEE